MSQQTPAGLREHALRAIGPERTEDLLRLERVMRMCRLRGSVMLNPDLPRGFVAIVDPIKEIP